MAEHCFISYSTADGLEFARQLVNEIEGGYSYIETWFDKDDLNPAEDWDEQIAEAIKSCKCLLFVMTKDSTMPNSGCKQEWTYALRYKKPVVPIRLHADIETPFSLGSRQWIDFSSNFDSGIAKLRKYIERLDSPEGVRLEFKHRLEDAQRDLKRAKTEEDKARIQTDINELKIDLQQQESIVKDPKKAEKQTRKNIDSGLRIERQSKKVVSQVSSTKFINPIPFTAPSYFQGRFLEIQQVADFLKDNDQRIMTIIGRAGGGKTALACYVLKSLELGQLPEDLGRFKVGGIIYLSEIGSHKVNVANIYADLLQLLPKERANKLEALYRQPKISIGDKVRSLLEEFHSDPIILLLDNFELFVDSETEDLLDLELKEILENLLRAPKHSIKVVITTRVPARDLALTEPGRQNNLHLDEGLKSPFAENVLRALDKDGRAGLKDAPEELLGRARDLTLGYPRALESLYAIISVDRYTNIQELLSTSLPETVVENLVGEAFSRLDINGQKVMQALAVCNRPVVPAAIDYLLQNHIAGINSSPILNRLVSMHFARREAGRFYLHPVDREYAFSRIPTSASNKHIGKGARSRLWNQHALILRAADYFVEARSPRQQLKDVNDLSAQFAEFDLRCMAQDYDIAASVLIDIDFDYLLLWGHYALMIEMHMRVKDQIQDSKLKASHLNNLGLAYESIGKVQDSIGCYEQALVIARHTKNLNSEAAVLGNLGNSYSLLCETHKAIEFYTQQLEISEKINNDGDKGTFWGNLGSSYSDIGRFEEDKEYLEKALAISRRLGNRRSESNDLCNIGVYFTDMGDTSKAIEYFQEALTISKDIGHRELESAVLENLADALLISGEINEAVGNYVNALDLADKIGHTQTQAYARWGLAQAYLIQNDLIQAHLVATAARSFDVPQTNHNISSLLGIIALRQSDLINAEAACQIAIGQADSILAKTSDYYDALDAKGLALCGLTLIQGKPHLAATRRTFSEARKITDAAGVVKRVLCLFDELAKVDTEGVLLEVRPLVEGKEYNKTTGLAP